jgi:hypothetical protein
VDVLHVNVGTRAENHSIQRTHVSRKKSAAFRERFGKKMSGFQFGPALPAKAKIEDFNFSKTVYSV